jgi:hypothetical protein
MKNLAIIGFFDCGVKFSGFYQIVAPANLPLQLIIRHAATERDYVPVGLFMCQPEVTS